MYRSHVLVCGGTGCTSSGSETLISLLQEELKKNGLENEVAIVKTGCHGLCAQGPVMVIYPDATFYSMVKPEDIPEIVSEHLLKGRVVTRLLYVEDGGKAKALKDTDFYRLQHRVALRNCGIINPESIDEYIGTGGYEALGRVLTEMSPDDVIETILASGLRGRGGAGFPTGMKWKFASGNRGNVQKYVCCNADEGDPGAFMDRSVLEGDPHAVIEAMAIAGYAVGAIPLALDGKYGYVGGHTMLDLCKRVLPKARAVVTMGTCAAYGGVQAAKPNPTGAVGVNECFARLGMDVKAINIPGCPPNPLNLVGTLVAFLQNKEIKLDDLGRPLMFYGQSVHDLCERRAHFDAGEFAPSFDSEEARKGWCLYDLGCKGPSTYNNCPKALFNETNWPVRAGHPCIGCSEPNFWDDLSPFYQN